MLEDQTALSEKSPAAPAPPVLVRWLYNLRIGWEILRARRVEDRTGQQAAAMTYNTLFSLLPVMVLLLVLMSLVLTKQQIHHEEMALVHRLGLSQLSTRGVTGATTKPQFIVQTIIHQIDKMRTVLRSPGTGIVGFITLLWAAISLMHVIETAFNRIYRVTENRPWTRKVTLYWCVLSLGPLAVAASLFASAKLIAMADALHLSAAVFTPFGILVSYAGDWALIFVIYKLIPNTIVRWKAAAVGALAATFLWEAGKYGFGFYVHDLAGYGKWYGNLGLIPLFMLWIFLTWNFLLLGLEIAFIQQFFPILKRRFIMHRGGRSTLTDSRWILPLAILMVHRFEEGKKLTAEMAANELGLALEPVVEMLSSLAKAGLILPVGGQPQQYVLAKAPENIGVAEILHAVADGCHTITDSMATTEEEHVLRRPRLREFYDLESQWGKHHTLAELAART
ncbi:MAG: YhjD/YihY/BrkB family envelope integrity protein [Phycisphaerae bacterium]